MDMAVSVGINRFGNQSVSVLSAACSLLCTLLCIVSALLTPCPAWGAGEVITWDDSMAVPVVQPTGESDNTVTVTFNNNGTTNMDVLGSSHTTNPANNNSVTITGAGTITGAVHAARSQSGMFNNTLTVTGTTLNIVNGATTDKSITAQNNTVTLTNVTVTAVGARQGSVNGAATAGLAKENTLTITGSDIQGWLTAGSGGGTQGKAEGNTLHIIDSTVFNAFAGQGIISAAGNTLIFEGNSEATSTVIAGEANKAIGIFDLGSATNNTLTIRGGTLRGEVFGGLAGLSAANNRVEIEGGTLRDYLYGGQSTTADATGNAVKISGGTLTNVYGGHASKAAQGNVVEFTGGATSANSLIGGLSTTADATGNVVRMSGGTATFEVHGGRGVTGVADNLVEFSGGTVKGDVYGGANRGAGSALRNTVIVSGTAKTEKGVSGGISDGGTAENNKVVVSGNADAGSVVGGFASNHDAKNNIVEMSGGSAQFLVGGDSNTAQATGNVVRMTGGTVRRDVRGAQGDAGVIDNLVDLSGGTVQGHVQGGRNRGAGSALRNTVILSQNIIVEGKVYGGNSEGFGIGGGTAESNAVTIGGNARVDGDVVGGYSQDHAAKSNTVEMTGGSAKSLTGGKSITAGATSNVVKTTGGAVGGEVRGGVGLTGVSDNGVDLSGGTVRGDVFGGQNTGAGSALRNTVVLADALVAEKSVYGGHSTGGAAEENAVSLSGTASVGGAVVGGYSQGHDVKNNAVVMAGGTIATYLAGGQTDTGAATGNTVAMTGGSVSGYMAGGQTLGGNATGNTVAMSGGSVATYMAGGQSNTGNAAGNTVDMSGGAFTTYLAGGQTDTGAATGNTVNIRGGTTGEFVYGGYATGAGGSGSATDNTVNLYGSPDLAATTIYGGRAGGDARSGNTLNVFTSNLVAKNVANFAKYNFILPDYVRPGHTVLRLTDTDPTVVGDAEVGVGKIGGGMLMQPGDRIFLLQNEGGGVQAEGMKSHNIRGQHGVAVEYLFSVRATDTTVEIYLDPATAPVRIRPEMKALSEAYVATLALINQGAELATKSAVAASRARTEDPWGLQVFGTVAGGSARYNTGSHVDLSGTNMVTGVTKALPVQNAQVLVGAFVEAGFARYQTHNGFSDRPAVGARGNNRYVGGGLLAHATQLVKDANGKMRPRGAYTEASLRAGRMDMDFASKDLRDATGRQATYDTNAPYFGAHFGTGYVWDLGESTTAEVYGQVYWTHLKGAKFSVLGDPVTVDDVNSWRLRAGARVNHAWNKRVSGYVGAAYEHGFDGKVNAKAYHLRIPSPKLQGGSGLAEAGLRITPSGDEAGFSADINVNGSVGHKQSLGGEVTLQYEF